MNHLLKSLFALLIMLAAMFFTASDAQALGLENRVGGFFLETLDCTGENDTSTRNPCRENGYLNYDTTSGYTVAANKGGKGGLNIFRAGPDGKATREATSGWREGDRMLNLPNQGSAKANWKQNSGRLREEMRKNELIFDSYRDPATGLQNPAGTTPTSGGRFLNTERQLLESRGWQYNPATGAYHPPGG